MKKVLILLFAIILSGCSKKSEGTRHEAESLLFFDTVTKIVAYTETQKEFDDAAALIFNELRTYHELYNIYKDYDGINNLKTINDNAGIQPVKVDKKIIDLLLFSKEQYTKTGGTVNVAFGSVLKIWKQYREEGIENPENAKLPSIEELKAANEYTNIDDVIIDPQASTVFLKEKNMSLDVGAVAKGYAVERAADTAIQSGFVSGLISVGGNVKALGKKDVGGLNDWNVGVQNPDNNGQPILKVLYVHDFSVVSSGDYQRYYTVDGKMHHHIISTDTLFPASYYSGVTIISLDSGIADALSTAVFNMPFEESKKFIEEQADTYAIWIFKDGEIKYSRGAEDFFNKR